jgi:hypothetical protein
MRNVGLDARWSAGVKHLELMVNHVAKFPRGTKEVEVAKVVNHGGVCGRGCSGREVPRYVSGRRLSGCFDGRRLIHGAVIDAANMASKCRGARSRHKCKFTSDSEDQ